MNTTLSADRSQTLPLVTVFGGGGFLGRRLALLLAGRGWRVRVASRTIMRDAHADILAPGVERFRADINDSSSVTAALADATAVVNLTGILSPTRKQTFDQAHYQGAQTVALAAVKKDITRLVHVSAIGADEDSSSSYARSKAAGEKAISSVLAGAIIMRPSIIFGRDDSFFNRFAAMARFSPVLPLIGGGHTLFQPVFVDDVAESIALALEGKAREGVIYELGGPEKRSFSDLLAYICVTTRRRRLLLSLPFPVATMLACGIEAANILAFDHLPAACLITRDQVKLLRRDNVVSDAARSEGRSLEGLGIKPHSIESVVPSYL